MEEFKMIFRMANMHHGIQKKLNKNH